MTCTWHAIIWNTLYTVFRTPLFEIHVDQPISLDSPSCFRLGNKKRENRYRDFPPISTQDFPPINPYPWDPPCYSPFAPQAIFFLPVLGSGAWENPACYSPIGQQGGAVFFFTHVGKKNYPQFWGWLKSLPTFPRSDRFFYPNFETKIKGEIKREQVKPQNFSPAAG